MGPRTITPRPRALVISEQIPAVGVEFTDGPPVESYRPEPPTPSGLFERIRKRFRRRG